MKKSVFLISAVLLICGLKLSAGESSLLSDSQGPSVSSNELYSKGVTLFFDNDYSSAASLFQQALAQDQENPAYYYFLGLSYLREGDSEGANTQFIKGAQAEFSPHGRLIDVPGHLRRIQGNERVEIEKVRDMVSRAYKDVQRQRQLAIYGSELEQQRRRLTSELANLSALSLSDSKVVITPDSLPSVPPIQPLVAAEVDGYVSEELAYSSGAGEIFELKDEYQTDQSGNILKDAEGKPLLKQSLSTKKQEQAARKAELKKNRQAAAENFVDVLSEDDGESSETAAEDESDNSEGENRDSEFFGGGDEQTDEAEAGNE